jgi:alpha-L-rhamnosidase
MRWRISEAGLGGWFVAAVVLWCGVAAGQTGDISVASPRCEYFVNPIGVDVKRPVLSWVINSTGKGAVVSGYQVLVASSMARLDADKGDVWDSGPVAAPDPIRANYGGALLASGQACYWKVRVRSGGGDGTWGPWSAAGQWTMGLLTPADWSARWIGAPADGGFKSLPIFGKLFDVSKPVSRAVVYICGLGQFELHLNGAKVGDNVLEPGWTNYRKTCLYVGYDVTDKIRPGANALGVMLGNGMYNSEASAGRYTKFTGSMGKPQLIACLRIEYADGSVQIVASDASWKTAAGPITFSSIYGGEDYDATLEQPGWDDGKLDGANWRSAAVTSGPGGILAGISASAPPVRVMKVFESVKTTSIGGNSVVFDLGQNCADIPRVVVHGKKGATIRIVPSETLGPNGTATQTLTGRKVWYSYTLGGGGSETYSPRFSYYGCRYIQVEGAVTEGDANPNNLPVVERLSGQFITGDSAPAGEFACSNDTFTRTASLIQWAMRSNMVSVLTDCPTREKLGWLEQDHLVGPSFMYDYDMEPLFRKVANDMRDSQTSAGLVPDIAPEFTVFSGGFRDSPEWGSASVLVPWETYQTYGDADILANSYGMMKRYVAYLGSKGSGGILNFGLGDWYDIGPKRPGNAQLTPVALTATAFYYRDLMVVRDAATILEHGDDATQYAQQAEAVRAAFNAKFFDAAKHTYSTGSQTAMAIPLVMGIVDPADAPAVLDNLVASIKANDDKLTSGDVGYRYLLRALADGGRSDVIYNMNIRADRPGYAMMIAKGQTALAEAWDANPASSEDHFMLGHINEWFYGNLAGIAQEDSSVGYAKIRIKPSVVGDVTWARASYNSIRGRISSSWKIDGGKFALDVTIPVGATATVWLPTSDAKSVKADDGVRPAPVHGEVPHGWADYAVGSGTYHFECALAR